MIYIYTPTASWAIQDYIFMKSFSVVHVYLRN